MGKFIVDTFTILIDFFYSYPSSFIDKIFRKFFSGYISSRSFLPFIDNEDQFLHMRIALSGQPSRQQSQVEMRIASLTTNNEHLIEELEKKQEVPIQEKKKPNEFQNKLIIHYTHEKRFNTLQILFRISQLMSPLAGTKRVLVAITHPRQSQVALSAATADIDNDPDADDTKQPNESTTKLDTATITNYQEKLFIHYTHEKRFNVFKRDMHHVYEDTFKSTPAMYTNLIVGNRNRRQASDELIHKRPTQTFLLNEITQSKHQNKI
ncbi:unnamed protein product [Rotaria magnacalcarata]